MLKGNKVKPPMKQQSVRSAALPLALAVATLITAARPLAGEESWIFRPSTFSHDPSTGQRVAQFMPERVSYRREDPTYMESGYRHVHAGLRGADGSYDHTHVVQTWGLGWLIRPYGEWEYPYRAGATPYGPWGNPSGPWTLPFDSWVNPYGLGRLPHPPWSPWYPWPYWPPAPHPGPTPSPAPAPGPSTAP